MKFPAFFVGLTFALSSIFWWLLGRTSSPESQHSLIIALMWCPGIAALVMLKVSKRPFSSIGWRLPSWRLVLAAYFIPIFYAAIAYGAVWVSGLGGFPNQQFIDTLSNTQFSFAPRWLVMPAYLLWIGTGLMLIPGLAALGEEIGWRGYLVPALADKNTPARTALLSGIVWAVWHYPSILLDKYNTGTLYATTCFTIMVIALSFIMAWFRLNSGSIWPCVLIHTTHNNFIELFFTPITAERQYTAYLIDEFGAALAATVIIAAVIVWSRKPSIEGAGEKGIATVTSW